MNRKVAVRGGDWLNEVAPRGLTLRLAIRHLSCGSTIGFRCARSLIEEQ